MGGMTTESGTGVAILLSTFNGERFLPEQLASFGTQTWRDWVLFWRDDGSSDGTGGVIRGFAAALSAGRLIAVNGAGRLGATSSFFALLREAHRGSADYFAFSDQDDVWLPEKLANGVAALAGQDVNRPALWFCGRTLVDAALRPIGKPTLPRRPPGFPASLTQNVAPGCCMMLNRAAADLIVRHPIPEGTWHDWWCYIVVSASGGAVIPGRTRDILYRQHQANLVGEARGFWPRSLRAARNGPGPAVTLLFRHIAVLQARRDRLPPLTRSTLDRLQRALLGGPIARLNALSIPGLVRQKWMETQLFRLWILTARRSGAAVPISCGDIDAAQGRSLDSCNIER